MEEKLKEKFEEMKAYLEELEVQASLGKMEAKEKMDEHLKNFNTFLHENEMDLTSLEKKGGETLEQIRENLDHAKVQLNLCKKEAIQAASKLKDSFNKFWNADQITDQAYLYD